MFNKRLMAMCPESKKYIVGNIFCQWIELMMNALMIYIIAGAVGKIYRGKITAKGMFLSLGILACVLIVRFFMTKKTTEMSYLASKTVKRVMREQIYKKIFKFLSEQEPKEKAAVLPEKGFNVSLSDVSFSYDGAKKVLSNADEILTMEGGRIS